MAKYKLTINNKEYRFLESHLVDGFLFRLESLYYDKSIYSPAEMTVTMTVTGDVPYDKFKTLFYLKPVSLTIKDVEVAKNYFVFKVKPTYRKISDKVSSVVELTICSQDKLLTLDKYSKAWTGRKLGDIFKSEVKGFKIGDNDIETEEKLNIVNYGTGEFIQPYLVQYNESLYDFLRRTANRCGEFLYFEKGKLNLGLTLYDTHQGTDYAKKASKRYYEDILQEGTKTSDYAYNYLKDRADPEAKPYSDPLACDDYLDDVNPEITNTLKEMGRWRKNLISTICMALEGTSFSKIVSNIGLTYAFKAAHAAVAAADVNSEYIEENITPFSGNLEQKNAQEQIRQFGTAMDQKSKISLSNINMNEAFYSLIRQAEKKVSGNAVYLEFGADTQALSIGDKINVGGTDYLVIGIKGDCDLDGGAVMKEHERVTAVSFYTVGKDSVPLPPALPDVTIRESQPQLAFIANKIDPKQIDRVRVRFAWQSDKDDASPWIRVQLPFASDGAGIKFRPEEGDEVMVSFAEGNIERPYVSGFLLSPRSNNSWGPLPNRTIMSKNGHGITFDDAEDGASFFYQLSPGIDLVKSFIPAATWPDTLTSKAGCMALAGGMTISDRFGLYRISLSSDSREVAIQSAMGDVKLSAFTGITISAPNGNIEIKGKNVSIEASNTVTIESGSAIKNRFVPDANAVYKEKGSKFWNSLGRTFVDIGVDGARGLMKRTVDQVLDLELVRTVMEVILRPIDGTTKIKSFTFVQIEAGKGSTEYPADARKGGNGERDIEDFMEAIDATASTIGTRVEAIHTAYDRMCDAIRAFNEVQSDLAEEAISLDAVKSSAWKDMKDALNYDWNKAHLTIRSVDEIDQAKNDAIAQAKQELGLEREPKYDDDKYKNIDNIFTRLFVSSQDYLKWHYRMSEIESKAQQDKLERDHNQVKQSQIVDAAGNLQTAINDLYMEINHGFSSEHGIQSPAFLDEVKKAIKKQEFKGILYDKITKDSKAANAGYWERRRKHYKREAVRALLADTDIGKTMTKYDLSLGSPASKKRLDDADKWKDMVKELVGKTAAGTFQEAKQDVFKNWFGDTYADPWKRTTVNRKRWKVGVEGKILLSDHPGKTITFNGKGDPQAQWNVVATDKLADKLEAKLLTIE